MKFQVIFVLVVLLQVLVILNADETASNKSPDDQNTVNMVFPARGKIGNVNVNPAPTKSASKGYFEWLCFDIGFWCHSSNCVNLFDYCRKFGYPQGK
jgi:hypothetical protein